jgi:hypothetical protein
MLTKLEEVIWTRNGIKLSAVSIEKFIGHVFQKGKCGLPWKVSLTNRQRTNRSLDNVAEMETKLKFVKFRTY